MRSTQDSTDEAPVIDLEGQDLTDVDLSGIDLSQLDLSKLGLGDIDLSQIDLSSVDLSQIDLSGVDLGSVDLSQVDLSGVDWQGLVGSAQEAVDLSMISTAGQESMDVLRDLLNDPSFGAQAGATGVLLAGLFGGLILWAAGGKLVKPMFGLLGLAAGAVLGLVVVPLTPLPSMVGLPPTWVGIGLGAVLGLLMAMILFRISIAVLASVALGGLVTLGTAIAIGLEQPGATESGGALSPQELLLEGVPLLDEDAEPPADGAPEVEPEGETDTPEPDAGTPGDAAAAGDDPDAAGEADARSRSLAFVRELWGELRATLWDPIPAWQRTTLAASTFMGLLGGLLAGMLFPTKCSKLVTSMAGAGVWIPSLVGTLAWLQINTGSTFDRTPIQWLVIWLLASIIGLGVQVTGGKRKKQTDDDD